MADITWSPGDIPTAAQFNSNLTHTGGAWNTWTPVVTQSATPTMTVGQASYHRCGRKITATGTLNITGAGTANNPIIITLPVTARGSTADTIIGSVFIFDASGSTVWPAMAVLNSATTFKMFPMNISVNAGVYTGQTTAGGFTTLASGDTIDFSIVYEAAAG